MMSKWCSRERRSVLMTLCILIAAGCKLSDPGLSVYLPPDQYFVVLSLEHHAINLSMVAPYDTVTLHTTHVMGDGSVVPGDVVYSVSSPSLSITDGVLKAESPVTGAVVRVTLTHGTITRTDSAIVSVIASAPNRLRDFGIRLATGDSAKHEVGSTKVIPLIRTAESGANLSALLVSILSSDTTVATIAQSGNNVRITPRRPGRVVLAGSTYAFGATWRDSLVFTSGWTLKFNVSSLERFTAGSTTKILDFLYRDITIGVGGCVMWLNSRESVDLDIQFADSTHVSAPLGSRCASTIYDPTVGGNIVPFRKIPYDGNPANALKSVFSQYAARVFSVPGVFSYRSVLHGTTGIVRVCDERNDTTCAPLRMGGWY